MLLEASHTGLNEDMRISPEGKYLVTATLGPKLFRHPKKYIRGIERDRAFYVA